MSDWQFDWQTLRRLLVVCLDDAAAIAPAMQLLRRSLSETEITVLAPGDDLPALQPGFEAAIIFTAPGRAPYSIAYLGYLADIPIRVGQSVEFGGSVLSHWVKPLLGVDPAAYHLHLLEAIGFQAGSIVSDRALPIARTSAWNG